MSKIKISNVNQGKLSRMSVDMSLALSKTL